MNKNVYKVLIYVLVFLIVTVSIGIAVYFSYARKLQLPKETEAVSNLPKNELYDELMAFNPTKDYPKTPEELMHIYNKSTLALYDENITDENTLKQILTVLRYFYDDEMLELNTFDDQLNTLVVAKQELLDTHIKLKNIEDSKFEINEKDINICYVDTVNYLEGSENLFFVHVLRKDSDGKWRIAAKKSANINFEALE